MAEKTSLPDYPRGITFEQVWAALMESREMQKETDRIVKETALQMKETDRRMLKLQEQIDKTDKLVGGLGNSIGGLIETLVAARLWEKFNDYPYGFKRVYRQVPIYETNTSKVLTDIDILLSDDQWTMAVEVKRDMVANDVTHHIERMKRIRKYPPAEAKGKRLLGAFACGTVDPDAKVIAQDSGFFILELKGESVELIPPPEGFSPKEW